MEDRLQKLKELKAICEMQQAMWTNELIECGEFTYGRPDVRQWDTTTRLKVGKFCSIGGNVQILLGGEHHTEWLTTYPFDVLIDNMPTPSKGDVTIGNDVWIGNNVTILSGVTIGDGAVIANGAVVAKDVAPYTIVGGVPAQFIRARENISSGWWDLPVGKLAEVIPILLSENVKEMSDWWWGYHHE